VHGILWGGLASVLEWVTLPVREMAWRDGIEILLSIAPVWSLVGMGLAAWIEIAGSRLLHPAFLVASTIACAILMSALWSVFYALAQGTSRRSAIDMLFPNGTNALASYLYQMWVIVFYGGLYFFVWTLNHRAERTRQLLAEAQVARMRAETLLGESQLAALREHVDPQFLLQVIAEAERRYTAETASADRLIGRLVSFLRLAMPGVRTGRSTLAAELQLAQAYAALHGDVGTSKKPAWSITAAETLPDIPLPPLFVAALLDGLSSSTDAQVRVEASVEGDRVVLRVDPPVHGDWLTPDRAYRVRVGLSTLYGNDWSFEPAVDFAIPMLTLPVCMPKLQRQETTHA
jgi:hypothetical protein